MTISWPQHQAAIAAVTQQTSQATLLFRPRDPFGALLNMHSEYKFQLGDLLIRSSEHLYQALRYPQSGGCQQQILAQKDPFNAKKFAYAQQPEFGPPRWGFSPERREELPFEVDKEYWTDELRLDVMQFCLFIKIFSHQEELLPLMDEARVGGLALVELSRKDTFWGMSLPSNEDGQPRFKSYYCLVAPGAEPEHQVVYGCNMLGKSLEVIADLPRPLKLETLLSWPEPVLSLTLVGQSLRQRVQDMIAAKNVDFGQTLWQSTLP